MIRLFILALLFTVNSYSQDGKLTIKVDGGEISYNLKNCYRRGKLLTTDQGMKFKVVVWNGYAGWVNRRYLIVRSIGGKYSTSLVLENLVDNVVINFDKDGKD